MEEIEIKSVKLVKGKTPFISYEQDTSSLTLKGRHEVHQDFKNAFEVLGLHLAIMTGYVPTKAIKSINEAPADLAEDFHARSYSLGGLEEDPGIVLSGHKVLANGKTVTLNSPFERLNAETENPYMFLKDLKLKIATVESEARKYMFEDKYSNENPITEDNRQGDLFKTNVVKPGNGQNITDLEFEQVDPGDQIPMAETGKKKRGRPKQLTAEVAASGGGNKNGIYSAGTDADPDAMERIKDL